MKALLQEGFAHGLRPHPDGGYHLDAFTVAPEWASSVSEADLEQYAEIDDIVAPMMPSDLAPIPTEDRPGRDFGYWVDDYLAAGEQWAAYRFLIGATPTSPVMQIGGRGVGIIRWIRATGCIGILLSPFESELAYARKLAREADCASSLLTVRAAAERLPFAPGSIPVIFAPGVLHHTDVGRCLHEVSRVLAPGGRFASWDIWDSPLYRAGIKVMGKREAIQCRPIDSTRLSDIPGDLRATLVYGGCFSRYVVGFLARVKVLLPIASAVSLGRIDLWLCRIPWVRRVSASLVSIHAVSVPEERIA